MAGAPTPKWDPIGFDPQPHKQTAYPTTGSNELWIVHRAQALQPPIQAWLGKQSLGFSVEDHAALSHRLAFQQPARHKARQF